MTRELRICVHGAAGDTGNLGVSALLFSTLGGIARSAPGAEVTVFDNGWGVRDARLRTGETELTYRRCGARLSRRYHRPESYANMRLSALLGGLGNKGVRAMKRADAVWDLSGGDSFADLYGARHLRSIAAPKLLTLQLGRPLVLLPQTYGPFRTEPHRALARRIVRASRLAWARDERSFEALRELLGDAFDARRHRSGVDVAFALESRPPDRGLPEPLATWLERGDRPVVGVNASGLLWNDPEAARRYGLAVDVRELLTLFLRRFLEETEARVVLVPHVVPTVKGAESDVVAQEELAGRFDGSERGRIALLEPGLDPGETKGVIARLDWFTGARMHATIGALSSLVPVGGQAYSRKMRGVFETCGVGEDVVDLRTGDTGAALAALWASWEGRERARAALGEHVPAVRARAQEELEESVEVTAAGMRSSA